jgi:hypothetical protein
MHGCSSDKLSLYELYTQRIHYDKFIKRLSFYTNNFDIKYNIVYLKKSNKPLKSLINKKMFTISKISNKYIFFDLFNNKKQQLIFLILEGLLTFDDYENEDKNTFEKIFLKYLKSLD